MKNGIHFISGLPRSGSTLLAALLRQNPRFHAEMSSSVAAIYSAAQGAMSGRNDYHVFIKEHQREAVLRGIFQSFYAHIQESMLVFDTNRIWCSKVSGLATLFPDSKILCCVRSLAWVLDSIERLVQKNALVPSKLFNFEAHGTVYTRAESLTGVGGMVRAAHDGLQEAFFGENAHRLLLIQYESLTRHPQSTMSAIYGFLGEKPFVHDFENVDYNADEFDRQFGMSGLHEVKRKVRYVERSSILPLELFGKFERSFWKDPGRNVRNVSII